MLRNVNACSPARAAVAASPRRPVTSPLTRAGSGRAAAARGGAASVDWRREPAGCVSVP